MEQAPRPVVTGNCYKCGTLELDGKWSASCTLGQVHSWQKSLSSEAVKKLIKSVG